MGKPKNQPSELVKTGVQEEQRRQSSNFGALRPELSRRYEVERNKNAGLFDELAGRYRNTLDVSIPETRSRFDQLARTGGVDNAARARMRGGGVFDEFSKTGGWDPGRIANFRGRIANAAPSFYGTLKNEMLRSKGVAGGDTPGFDASLARLAREQSKSHTENIREGELGLAGQIDEGRRFGAQGMSESERALQGLLSQNTIAGLTGMADTDRSTLAGLEGMRGLRTDTPSDLAFLDRILQLEGMDFEQRRSLLALMSGVPDKQGFFDKFGNALIGAGGALAGGLVGGRR